MLRYGYLAVDEEMKQIMSVNKEKLQQSTKSLSINKPSILIYGGADNLELN